MKNQTKKLIKKLKDDEPRFRKNVETLAKKGKGKPIKDEVFHKVKAGDRRREIELNKLDAEIAEFGPYYPDTPIKGEFAKHKELKAKYTRMIWRAVFILIGIVVAYPIFIMIMDLFYGK